MEFVTLAIGLLIGLLIGVFVGIERMRKAIERQSVGRLRIDRSDPDEPPIPFLEVTGSTIESISHMKIVVLKVINESYISHN